MSSNILGAPLRVVSLSHLSAPVELRELFHLPEERYPEFLRLLRDGLGIAEAMVLSTCNRTEVYYVAESDQSEGIIKTLHIEKGIAIDKEYIPYFLCLKDPQASIKHLFRVSTGLESHVLGDLQISKQVKQAYKYAHEAEMANAYLHRLMHTIFHAHKRVQQETPFRDGAASVSYAASELALKQISYLSSPKILVIGTGEMGGDVIRNLAKHPQVSLTIANRTLHTALTFKGEIENLQVISLGDALEGISKFDLILSTVSSESPILFSQQFKQEIPQTVIDLSVPRSVDDSVKSLPSVQLFNIDDIRTLTQQAVEKRRRSIPMVENIIVEEIQGFSSWHQQLHISPTIHRIKGALEKIRKEELARFLKDATDKETRLLEEFSTSMMNKVMRMPVLQLKEACRRGNPEELMDVLNDLFDLEGARKKHQAAKKGK